MNNIYVETMPSACDKCPCCNSDIDYGACCNLGAYGYVDYYPTTRKHPKCPLKPLADRLAEERKRVVQELKSLLYQYVNIDVDVNYEDCNYSTITDYGLKKIIDQIERGE